MRLGSARSIPAPRGRTLISPSGLPRLGPHIPRIGLRSRPRPSPRSSCSSISSWLVSSRTLLRWSSLTSSRRRLS
eukprot:4664254-Pyramimonas_sp.AAC.1